MHRAVLTRILLLPVDTRIAPELLGEVALVTELAGTHIQPVVLGEAVDVWGIRRLTETITARKHLKQ